MNQHWRRNTQVKRACQTLACKCGIGQGLLRIHGSDVSYTRNVSPAPARAAAYTPRFAVREAGFDLPVGEVCRG